MTNRYMAVRQEIKLAFIFDYEQNYPIDLRLREITRRGNVKLSNFAQKLNEIEEILEGDKNVN